MRVLLVESDSVAANNLASFLEAMSLRPEMADTGEDALEFLRHYEFDIVVLNLSLCDMDGSRLISRMRTARCSTPVLALSRRLQPRARVDAFKAGADDVVDEHLDRTELFARMRAIIRRSRGHSQSTLRIGPLSLDLERHEVLANGKLVPLTGKEFQILQLLMLRKNMILTKEAILVQIYSGMDEPALKIIDVFVCKLRKKLAQAGLQDVIGTVWGRGYTIRDIASGSDQPAMPDTPRPAELIPHRLAFA
jgi:two-component system, cell cycle response regulator CtrA